MTNNPYEFNYYEPTQYKRVEYYEYSYIKVLFISILVAVPFLMLSLPFISFYYLIKWDYKGLLLRYEKIITHLDNMTRKKMLIWDSF